MSFRARVRIALLVLTLLPLGVLAFVIQAEVEARLLEQARARLSAQVEVVEQDIDAETRMVRSRLAALARRVEADNRIRAALAAPTSEDRAYLLDYAASAAELTGLDMLQMQTRGGRIVSSGHFRNEFDRSDAGLTTALVEVGGVALVASRSPSGPFLALASVDSVRVGGTTLDLVGGVTVDATFLDELARGPELSLTLTYPGGLIVGGTAPAPSPTGRPTASLDEGRSAEDPEPLTLPLVGGERSSPVAFATLAVDQSSTTIDQIRRSATRWFALVFGGAALVSLVGAGWLASLVTRPLEELAARASRIELERVDVGFATERRDEIGRLSRLLNRMTERLRASARGLKEAERRATLGEMARQVTHDIKNGLAPIRNVMTHLTEVGTEQPDELPRVFKERRGTLTSSITYLEELASNYARIGGRPGRGTSDVFRTVHEVAAAFSADSRGRIDVVCPETVPPVACEHVGLRRILDNLVTNALESMNGRAGSAGRVTITIVEGPVNDDPVVRIVVADNGVGMSDAEVTKSFQDFYTTKAGGTGLGLSVVRRLVMDAGGSVSVESSPREGTTVAIFLPVAGGVPENGRSAE